jgi:hypothetical protein
MRKYNQLNSPESRPSPVVVGAVASAFRSTGGFTPNMYNQAQNVTSPKNYQVKMAAMQKQANSTARIPSKRVVIRASSNTPDDRKTQLAPLQVDTMQQRAQSPSSSGINLLYLEDFDSELDPLFINQELKPYLQGVFADLALRSQQS